MSPLTPVCSWMIVSPPICTKFTSPGVFEKAAAQNHPAALMQMGVFAEDGRGGPKDKEAAKSYYERAAALGNADAKAALASFDDPEHPICRVGGDSGLYGYTTGSMVSTLSRGSVESEISIGPPSQNPWRLYRLGRQLALKGLSSPSQ